jgi:hypothetical protein
MQPDYVTVHRRALSAVDLLSPEEREAVWGKFATLRELPGERWPQEGVRRTKPDGQVFVAPATPDLLVFFSVEPENGFLIEDFAPPGRLEYFLGTHPESVAQT